MWIFCSMHYINKLTLCIENIIMENKITYYQYMHLYSIFLYLKFVTTDQLTDRPTLLGIELLSVNCIKLSCKLCIMHNILHNTLTYYHYMHSHSILDSLKLVTTDRRTDWPTLPGKELLLQLKMVLTSTKLINMNKKKCERKCFGSWIFY